ncbi:HAD-IIB family hydrolase [Sphingomonas prati]|nr:HAD-IIB family hydrolase [Sphingomonas prati]GGE75349.1 sucrose-phosphate synthase [Sphingomonas prati]
MFVMHIALQGCLRARDVEYGVNADTGGHIRYLLDLARASAAEPRVDRIEIVTRGFRQDGMADCYAVRTEDVDAKTRIVRLETTSSCYLAKEALWAEHDSFSAALIAHIAALDRRPDIFHAHYADGGEIARRVGAALDIPFLFTAHSLGRVKRDAFAGIDDADALAGMDRRIALEERTIAAAAGIIASSRDEAEVQYAGYDAYRPGRIRVIEPGSDLAAFADAAPDPAMAGRIDRFLTDPDKPMILAIARPVTKKNLAGLVHAYGNDPHLRRTANLVIVAGIRDDIARMEPEIASNLDELLRLIDRYDLYGQVAYPKHHLPSEVPSIYALARRRGGVFVNPALNEPFGLTLLEAAAAGLPIVATDSGGPNDIIERCGNGVLVDPRDHGAMAAAIGRILDDRPLWERYSRAGAVAVAAYDWTRHAELYHDFAESALGRRPPRALPADPSGTTMLISDIDNTLVGCPAATVRFADWHGRQEDLLFGIATGRSLHSAQAILSRENVPQPQVLITSVGSEIYHLDRTGTAYDLDEAWATQIAAGWDRPAVAAILAYATDLQPQGSLEQRLFKLSYFTRGDPDAARRVRDLLRAAGHACSVIQSHGTYLDILPHAASKGTAVEHVRRHYGMARDQVMVAGDSGNDVEMLRSVRHSIIVANHSDGLDQDPTLAHSFVSSYGHAGGIIEGVDHFRQLAQRRRTKTTKKTATDPSCTPCASAS